MHCSSAGYTGTATAVETRVKWASHSTEALPCAESIVFFLGNRSILLMVYNCTVSILHILILDVALWS
jgi:hypothetical protein